MRSVATLVVLVVLAGCSDPSAPVTEPNVARPDQAVNGGEVTYSCPGAGAGPEPCGIPTTLPGVYGIEDLDVLPDGTVHAIGSSATAGEGTASDTPDPGLALATSTDQGVSWDLHMLPTVATPSTRTGSSGGQFASLAVAEDGTLLVVARLAPDPERRVIGGEPIPEPLQARHDIAAFTSTDRGATWTSQLLVVGGAAYQPLAWSRPGGGAVVSWYDADTALTVVAASRDLHSWVSLVDVECRYPDLTWSEGFALMACVQGAYNLEDAGPLQVHSIDLDTGSLRSVDFQDGLGLDCTRAHFVQTDVRWLVGSGCPGIEILRQEGETWVVQARTPLETLGISASLGSAFADAVGDDGGRLHGILEWANATVPICCFEQTFDHVTLDPWTGAVMHHQRLGRANVDGPDALPLLRQMATYTPGSIEWSQGAGWLAWLGDPPRVGRFDVS